MLTFRRRMRRPAKPYTDINPFELLQQQNYRDKMVWSQQAHDGYYMSTVINQIPPPPYSLHNFNSVICKSDIFLSSLPTV